MYYENKKFMRISSFIYTLLKTKSLYLEFLIQRTEQKFDKILLSIFNSPFLYDSTYIFIGKFFFSLDTTGIIPRKKTGNLKLLK